MEDYEAYQLKVSEFVLQAEMNKLEELMAVVDTNDEKQQNLHKARADYWEEVSDHFYQVLEVGGVGDE